MRDWSPPALRASVHGDAGAVPLSRNDGYLTSDGSAAPDIFIAGLAAQRGVDLLGRAVQPVAQHDDGVVLGVHRIVRGFDHERAEQADLLLEADVRVIQ